MAFIKLWPRDDDGALPVLEVVDRLREEFEFVSVDTEAGRDHVGDMIAATLSFPDTLPWKADRLAELKAMQEAALYVSFGDDLDVVAGSCVLPGEPLFFGNLDEVDGPARSLVERAAKALRDYLEDG